MASVQVSVNGVPVEKVIDDEVRQEYCTFHHQEIRGLAFVVAMSRSQSTSKVRNHSGCKSGRGRVIYSVGGVA
jgi:hypothetical protein